MNRFLKFTFLISIFFCAVSSLFSQNNSEFYVKYIDTVDLRIHLTELTSTDFEGRLTGTTGQRKAAEYIQSQFMEMNCKAVNNEFYQPFKLYKDVRSGIISLNNQILKFPSDFGFFTLSQTFSFDISEFLFVDQLDDKKDYSNFYLVFQTKNLSSIKYDLEAISCKGIIFILSDYDERYFSYATEELRLEKDSIQFPVLFINQKSLSPSFNKSLKKKKNPALKINGKLNLNPSFISTENVIGYIEGSDSILKKEVIIISAHYDHLGSKEGEIYYGADDNGSGTAALIELTSAFQHAKNDGKQPKRSILMIAFTGEELGLLGSAYYVSNPLIPLAKTVANLNIDMIGRKTEKFETDSLLMVYMIGANRLSLELDSVIKATNSIHTNIILDKKFNALDEPQKLYYRSDHYNFAKNSIPSCFFFGGFHDDYHKPTDTIEKISFEKIEQIARLVFHTAWRIADAPERLKLISVD
jgi:hypothetical protein